MSDEHDQRVPDGRPWWIEDMLLCIGFLSRLPVPQPATLPVARPLMRAAWAFPVVGCLIGLAGAAVLSGAVDVNLAPRAGAAVAGAATSAAPTGRWARTIPTHRAPRTATHMLRITRPWADTQPRWGAI